MKKKFSRLGTKIILILFFFIGFCLICNLAFSFGETEEVEGIVEHTYMSGAANGVRAAGGTIAETPMCRVVWYDKDGEKVIYGMPNDKDYAVGDSYFVQVDAETNRIPKRTAGEGVVSVIIGLLICIACVFIWRKKFGKKKQKID